MNDPVLDYHGRIRTALGWMRADGSLFQRRSPPRRLDTTDKEAAEIEAIARAVARAMPSRLTHDALADRLADMGDHLEQTMRGGVWPTPHEVADAIKAVTKSEERTDQERPVEGLTVERAIAAGEVQDEREARWRNGLPQHHPEHRGYVLSDEQRRRARDQAMHMAEWEYHLATLMTLKGADRETVEREELAALPPGALPRGLRPQAVRLQREAGPVERVAAPDPPPVEPPARPSHWTQAGDASRAQFEELRRARVAAGMIADQGPLPEADGPLPNDDAPPPDEADSGAWEPDHEPG